MHLVSEAKDIYASTALITEIMRSGGEIYQNSHTNYFAFAEFKPTHFVKKNPEESITKIWDTYINFINQKVKNQEFDLIILDQWTHLPIPFSMPSSSVNETALIKSTMRLQSLNDAAQLKNHYQRREVIALSLANRPGGGILRMSVWEPIPDSEGSKFTVP